MTTRRNRTRRLWRSRRPARLFAVALVLVCGCRVAHPGVLVEHRPGDAPKACPVPYAATYALQAVDETGTGATLLERAAIQHKFQVGFIREADGSLVAYAGGRKFPLPEGHYYWQITPETQKTRGDLAQADAGKALAVVGKGLAFAGAFVVATVFGMLGAFMKSGAH